MANDFERTAVGASDARSRRSSRFAERVRPDALPGLPTPDAWSRRWVIVCAIALVAGTLMPVPGPQSGLVMPWSLVGTGGFGWMELAFPVLPALFALLALKLRGTVRGMTVFLATLALQVIGVLVTTSGAGSTVFDTSLRGDLAIGILLVLVMLLGLLGVAVGNHIRKREPASGVASGLSGIGGLLLLVVFVLPIKGMPIFRIFFDAQVWRFAWSVMMLLLVVLGFAILGVRSFSSNGIAGRCFLTSLVARVLLFGYSLALVVILATQFTFGIAFALSLRAGLLFAGPFCLLCTGLAAWIEGTIVAKRPAPLDSRQAAKVFA